MTSEKEFREEEEGGAHFQHPPPIPLSWAFPQGFFPVERGENQIKPTTLIIAGKGGDGGANLSRISFTLLASNFDFSFSYLDVDFKEKIAHPHLSRKSSTLTNSKREKEEMPDVAAKEEETSIRIELPYSSTVI